MNEHAPKPTNLPETPSGSTVTELVGAGRIEDAINAVRGMKYTSNTNPDQISDLKRVLRAVQYTDDGPKAALALTDELVLQPEATDSETNWQKKSEASFYDYMIQELVIGALKQQDFSTAAEVVKRMDDWYVGAAMGGDDLLALAYDAKDPAILAAVWTLIKWRWGNGRAHEDVPKLAESITDPSMIDAINGWLDETDLEYRIPNV